MVSLASWCSYRKVTTHSLNTFDEDKVDIGRQGVGSDVKLQETERDTK